MSTKPLLWHVQVWVPGETRKEVCIVEQRYFTEDEAKDAERRLRLSHRAGLADGNARIRVVHR